VFFKRDGDLAAVPLVIGGATAAASGRLVFPVPSAQLFVAAGLPAVIARRGTGPRSPRPDQ